MLASRCVAGRASVRMRCQRDSVTVGSIPDDYRTNHPIVIAEKDQVIDLPVGAGDRGMTRPARRAAWLLRQLRPRRRPDGEHFGPVRRANDVAASHVRSDFVRLAKASGVPESRSD